MNKKAQLPPIYLICDRHKHAPNLTFWETLEELLAAGVGMVQLREKDLSANQLLPLAQQARELTNRYNALLLINDRIDIALAVKADGVHLGGHSLPAQIVRSLCADDFLIGVSTHASVEIENARLQGADFVTFGPIFYTASKAKMGSPIGSKALMNLADRPFPIYPLGGINDLNLPQLIAVGADRIAAISAFLESRNPEKTVNFFMQQLRKNLS
jgi:thiamine-phosphate pyrophosphorylase